MDSLDLISSKKKDNFPLNKNENKVNKFIKYILILLILSFFPNIYTSYSIFKLNKKVNIVNINTSKNYQKYDNEIDNESNINKIIPFVKDNNIEEYIKIQKNFCNYPDKFYFKKYEELIFFFLNFS